MAAQSCRPIWPVLQRRIDKRISTTVALERGSAHTSVSKRSFSIELESDVQICTRERSFCFHFVFGQAAMAWESGTASLTGVAANAEVSWGS
jgi:hypothetical protein